jgi:hypothetical protein
MFPTRVSVPLKGETDEDGNITLTAEEGILLVRPGDVCTAPQQARRRRSPDKRHAAQRAAAGN